jgi:hypothetical protein
MIIEIIIGFIGGFTALWIAVNVWIAWKEVDQFDVDEAALIEGLDCGSYNLRVVDRYDGVEWVRGGDDGTCFACMNCGRQFSDEDWDEAVATTVDLSGMQD